MSALANTASVVAKANKVRFMLRPCEMNPDCWRKPGNKKAIWIPVWMTNLWRWMIYRQN